MIQLSVRNVFQVLEYLILIGLTIVSIILSWEAILKYKSKNTNLNLKFEKSTVHSTVTICFKPIQEEYLYGKDFHFNIYENIQQFQSDKNQSMNVLKIGENPSQMINMTILESAYDGKCFKLSSTEVAEIQSTSVSIAIKFSENILEIPLASIYFTSPANALGIARAFWYEGVPFQAEVSSNSRQEIKLVEYEYNYLKELSGCHESQSWYNCYADLAESLDFKECPSKCFAHSLRDGEQKLAFCKPNTPDWTCSNKLLRSLRRSIIREGTCPRSCHIKEYTGSTKLLPGLNRPNTIIFTYFFSPPFLNYIYQEYILFDFLGLISAVGGTLGIFIGISILAVISSCFSYFVSWIEKCSTNN